MPHLAPIPNDLGVTMKPAKFDARKNLFSVVESILAGDRPSQELTDAAVGALDFHCPSHF